MENELKPLLDFLVADRVMEHAAGLRYRHWTAEAKRLNVDTDEIPFPDIGPFIPEAIADFKKTTALTNKFDRTEVRILAKMLVLRAVLGDETKDKLKIEPITTDITEEF